MFIIRVLFILTFAISAQANWSQKCQNYKKKAEVLFKNSNALFGTNVSLSFITDYNRNYMDPPEDSKGLTLGASHSHIENKVEMADPCHLIPGDQVNLEAYLFVVAHEFAHHIIDGKPGTCYSEFVQFEGGDPWKKHHSHHMHAWGELGHANVDILALKMLHHLKIDQRKAVRELERNDFSKKVVHDFSRRRYKLLHRVMPTDFSSGHDFFAGNYMHHPEIINRTAKKHAPNTTMAKDLKKVLDKHDQCHMFKKSEKQKDLNMFKSLNRELGIPNQEPVAR